MKTVLVRVEGNQVSLETDMGDAGTGNSWDAAMADLKAKAPGTVFLERPAICCWRKAPWICCRSCLRKGR